MTSTSGRADLDEDARRILQQFLRPLNRGLPQMLGPVVGSTACSP
jgi:hypothetical protein